MPRHWGNNPGATINNKYEKYYNLKISKYMYDRLKELGVQVTLTRDTDEALTQLIIEQIKYYQLMIIPLM